MSAPTWASIEEPPGRAETMAAMRAPRRRWVVQTHREQAAIMVIDKPGVIAGLPYQYLNQLKKK
jgi:hypothetical protein